MRTIRWFVIPVLAVAFAGTSQAGDTERKVSKELASFGILKTLAPEVAKAQALDWLKTVKSDEKSLKEFEAIWKDSERMVLDQVADTLALGDADAASLLANARDVAGMAPVKVPAILKDGKRPTYFRANLALAYAKALSGRRIYEESLAALKTCKVEQVVDPGSYLFYRGVAEYAMQFRTDANYTILRLLDDVSDTPDRYKTVASLMVYDMLSWKDKDMGWISRTAGNVERRLDLSRGGQVTQKMEKDVINRLDEMIKKLENEKDGCCCGGGCCPNGGSGNGGGARPSSPMRDSKIANNGGPGQVDPKRFKEVADVWGKLPAKERAQAILDLTRELPPQYRARIEEYYKKSASK